MTAPADVENRLIALAVAMCDARAHISGSSGEATGAVLVCTLPRGHDGSHRDEWDRIRWEQEEAQ